MVIRDPNLRGARAIGEIELQDMTLRIAEWVVRNSRFGPEAHSAFLKTIRYSQSRASPPMICASTGRPFSSENSTLCVR